MSQCSSIIIITIIIIIIIIIIMIESRRAADIVCIINIVGPGGTLVELMPFDWRVAGLNPALAAT